MAKSIPPLTPVSPLAGYALKHGGTELSEVTGLALISLAIPDGKESVFAKAARKAWKVTIPAPGMSVAACVYRLAWTAPGQYHLVLPEPDGDPLAVLAKDVTNSAWITDQSDSYAMLRLAGPLAREALERICPLDLDPAIFAIDAANRTVMEHLGVLLIRESEDSYLLLSARSSARSFLHAVETSLHNVV